MTDLVQRYLAAVRRRLPETSAKDIIAELDEAITSKIEAQEAQNGRSAGADEVASILKDFGHPAIVASRYSGRDYLIGPQLYPWFWDAQRVGVGLIVAILIAIAAVRALGSQTPIQDVLDGVGGSVEAAIWMFGAITAVFIVLERTKSDVKLAKRWNPKNLPKDHIRAPKPLFDSLFALAFDAIFILWWIKAVDFPNDAPGRTSLELHFSDAWAQVHTPVLVLALFAAGVHLVDIVKPAWSRLRALASILGHAGGLGVLWVLARAGPLVSVTSAAEESEKAIEVAEAVNGMVTLALGLTGLGWAVVIGLEIWRIAQSIRPGRQASGAAA